MCLSMSQIILYDVYVLRSTITQKRTSFEYINRRICLDADNRLLIEFDYL